MAISIKPIHRSEIEDNPAEAAAGAIVPSQYNAGSELLMATARLLGRVSDDPGAAEELTASQVKTLLGLANAALRDAANTFSAPQRISFTALSYAATVTPNLANNNAFTLTMTGNPTIANPSNMAAAVGQEVLFVFRGAFQPSFGSYFKFPGGAAPSFSGSLNAIGGLVISSTEILMHGAAGYS